MTVHVFENALQSAAFADVRYASDKQTPISVTLRDTAGNMLFVLDTIPRQNAKAAGFLQHWKPLTPIYTPQPERFINPAIPFEERHEIAVAYAHRHHIWMRQDAEFEIGDVQSRAWQDRLQQRAIIRRWLVQSIRVTLEE